MVVSVKIRRTKSAVLLSNDYYYSKFLTFAEGTNYIRLKFLNDKMKAAYEICCRTRPSGDPFIFLWLIPTRCCY